MGIRHHNLRKAAVLVASLDPEHAAALLAQMTSSQAQSVRRAVERLGEVDLDEQSEVIDEFFRIGPLMPAKQPSGIELDDRLPAHLARSPAEFSQSSVPAGRDTPLSFLDEASPQALAGFLEREHPQTIAVVVSHLGAERAVEVLAHLRPELQVEVARRLSDLDQTEPEIIHEVERGLQTWLSRQMNAQKRGAVGSAALGKILEAAGPRMKQHILSHLNRDSRPAPPVAQRSPPPLTFDQLEHLDSASLTVVLHHAQPELLVLALAGARAAFADRVFDLFPSEESAALSEALSHLGPTRLSDVEEAQRELAELARQLELRGEIAPDARVRALLSVAV